MPVEPPRPEPSRPRLIAADDSDRLRVRVGSIFLVAGASIVISTLARLRAPRGALHAAERTWARAAVRLLRLRLDIEGSENADPSQSYVIVALHEGLADVIPLLHLPLPLRFLARDELFSWPSLGRYLRATNQIEVSETRELSSLRRTYAEAKAALAGGESLVVFAQGSILGIEVAFQAGALRIARALGVSILPVVLTGSHCVWEHPYSPLVRLDQRVFMRVLPAVSSGQMSVASLRELEREMKRIALQEATADPRHFDPDRDGWWDGYQFEIDPDFPELASRLASRWAGSG